MSNVRAITATPSIPLTQENRSRVLRFVRDKTRAGAVRFDLRQIVLDDSSGPREGRVDSWNVATSSGDEIANDAHTTAVNDSRALGGVNAYALVAFTAEGLELARASFREAADFDAGAISPSEKPSLIGMRSQEMRHNEFHAQLSVRSALDVIDVYKELLQDARIENAEIRAELGKERAAKVEFMATYESMVSQKSERELAIRQEDRKDQAQREMISKLTLLWPVLLNKLSGAKGSSLTGQQALMFETLMTHLTKEDMVGMASKLPVEKQIVLWELLAPFFAEGPPPAPAHESTEPPKETAA